jgi:hypothetical protein
LIDGVMPQKQLVKPCTVLRAQRVTKSYKLSPPLTAMKYPMTVARRMSILANNRSVIKVVLKDCASAGS